MLADVEHHYHKKKQHHDGAGVDDELERGEKRSANDVKNHGDGEQRNDEIQKRMHGVAAGYRNDGG